MKLVFLFRGFVIEFYVLFHLRKVASFVSDAIVAFIRKMVLLYFVLQRRMSFEEAELGSCVGARRNRFLRSGSLDKLESPWDVIEITQYRFDNNAKLAFFIIHGQSPKNLRHQKKESHK
jgi:hypothetical protein